MAPFKQTQETQDLISKPVSTEETTKKDQDLCTSGIWCFHIAHPST